MGANQRFLRSIKPLPMIILHGLGPRMFPSANAPKTMNVAMGFAIGGVALPSGPTFCLMGSDAKKMERIYVLASRVLMGVVAPAFQTRSALGARSRIQNVRPILISPVPMNAMVLPLRLCQIRRPRHPHQARRNSRLSQRPFTPQRPVHHLSKPAAGRRRSPAAPPPGSRAR